MRAAQLKHKVVINFAEVDSFNEEFVDPLDSEMWSIWTGEKFIAPIKPGVSIAEFEAAVQQYMDDTAKSYGYDDLISAISYATDPTSLKWQQEGVAFRTWRSNVWLKCLEISDSVGSAKQAAPSKEELIKMLPSLSGMPT